MGAARITRDRTFRGFGGVACPRGGEERRRGDPPRRLGDGRADDRTGLSEHTRNRDGDGLDGLTRIGTDEVAYRKSHRYLMCVVCHDSGRVVWAAPGRSQLTAAGFFQQLGPERCKRIAAVSVDLHGGWLGVIRHYCQRGGVRRPLPRDPPRRRRARPAPACPMAEPAGDRPGACQVAEGHAQASQRPPARRGPDDPRSARRNQPRRLPRMAAARPAQSRIPRPRPAGGDALARRVDLRRAWANSSRSSGPR